jgi:surface carbohydrate biosynthesis protein
MRRLKLLILKIENATFKFSLPSKNNLMIFDDMSIEDLKYVISDFKYFILQTRFENVTTLYINPLIILKTIFNYRGNLWSAYLITIINLVSPKVILTAIDNSIKFFEIAKKLQSKDLHFFAIQNGARYDLKRYLFKFKKKLLKEDMTRKFFIPNFFCYGEFEVDDYKNKNINVQNFLPVGSLRLANFMLEKEINLKQKNYLYDILLVSDGITQETDQNFGTEGEVVRMAKFIKYTIKYASENRKRIILSLKRLNSTRNNLEQELKFYKKNLNDFEYDYLISNSTINYEKSRYLTYELMLKSNLTISSFSTLLRENLSIGRKSLSVNFMENNIFDFPLEGLCKLKNCDYDKFQNKLNAILEMSEEDFTAKSNHKNYLMLYDNKISTIDNIKKKVSRYLT